MIVKPDYCPTWFDITLYDLLKDYSRNALASALQSRQMSYRYVSKELPKKVDHEERERCKNNSLELLEFLATDCLKDTIKLKNSQKENYNPLECISNIISPVAPSDIVSLYVDFYLDAPEMRKLFQKVKLSLDSFIKHDIYDIESRDWLLSSITELPENQYLEDEIHSFNQYYKKMFWIDFSQNDEVLKMAFEQKLKEVREKEKTQKRTKRFSDAEIKKIIEYRVFAYIDLYIYEKITGRKFTNVEMAAMIYPPTNNTPSNFDPVDRINRTVRPKAIELLEKTNPRLLL